VLTGSTPALARPRPTLAGRLLFALLTVVLLDRDAEKEQSDSTLNSLARTRRPFAPRA
jgi:hypothetical protein